MPGADREGRLTRRRDGLAPGARDEPLEDAAVRAALGRSETYAGMAAGVPVASVQTHLSQVFLCGDRVYKFRKPVSLGFVDWSRRAERDADCLREVALNRRLAPDVYLGVAPLELGAGVRVGAPRESLAPGGPEHCVVMRRLPEGRDALSLLLRGALGPAQLDRVAARIARFHAAHELGTPAPYSESGWLAHCEKPAADNFSVLREFAASDPALCERVERLEARTRRFPSEHAQRFEARRRAGRAVDAHGDLHLAHVWFERDDAEPLAIDCLEFDAELRRIDAASEVAFLAMDLRYRGAAPLAEHFLRVYASERDDFDLYTVVDWFASYRAAVRAKVAAIAAAEPEIEPAQRQRAAESARRHVALALDYLEAPCRPALVLVGGAVGTGKSTVAAALADALGAVVVSSDRVRKHRLGLERGARADAAAYAPEAKSAVYEALLARAEPVLASGRVAVLDASFGSRRERERVWAHAEDAGVPALFVETRCAPELATSRLAARQRAGGDASDAGPELHAASRAGFEPLEEWRASRRAVLQTDDPSWRGAALDALAARVASLRIPGNSLA